MANRSFKIIFFLLLLFLSALCTFVLRAQETPKAESGDARRIALFRPYRLNYFLPYTYSPQKTKNDTINTDRQNAEAKFQISIRSDIVETEPVTVSLFYSQRAFWQVFDEENSRPFREVNYNPGLIIASKTLFKVDDADIHFEFIFDHISNGQIEPYSRSQNRVSVSTVVKKQGFYFEWRLMERLAEKDKEYADDPKGDENPDIHKYQGYNEFYVNYTPNNDFYFGGWTRGNPNYGHYSLELNAGFKPSFSRTKIMLQYFNGYMESMIDYNRHITKYGIGVMFGV